MNVKRIFRTLNMAHKPFRLVSLVMTYALGAGFVQFVREMRSWLAFIQGGVFLLLIVLSVEYLIVLQRLINPQYWPKVLTSKDVRQVRLILAALSGSLLTVVASIFISWMQLGLMWQGLGFLLLALILVSGLYFLSQVVERVSRLSLLIEVLLFIVIPPAVAFFLQSDSPHRLLTLVVLALVPGYLANRLLVHLKRFSSDQRTGIHTIVIDIGWENAMFYHNAFILLSYLLYAVIALFGFPWFILWPVFLTLPIGLVEIWLIERVKRGARPQWKIMQFATACVLFLPLFLIGFAFWIR